MIYLWVKGKVVYKYYFVNVEQILIISIIYYRMFVINICFVYSIVNIFKVYNKEDQYI